MALNKFYKAYTDNNATKKARKSLVAAGKSYPTYKDNYANDIRNIYNNIKSNNYEYDAQNDLAYRRYADEYRALAGLAVADNQAQAQDLTGGFGSTYAPEVARQGEARLNAGVEAVQPAFYQLGYEANDANLNRYYNMYSAAADRRDAGLADYQRQAELANDKYNLANQRYRNEAEFGYQKYTDSRDIKTARADLKAEQKQNDKEYILKKYDVYNNIAANKCADFNDKGNNKGMKAYLNGLVKAGKLTQYMADNLYKQYKYVAPKPTQTRTTRTSGSGGNVGNGGNPEKQKEFTGNEHTNTFIYDHRNKANITGIESDIRSWYENDKLTAEEAKFLRKYYNTRAKNVEKTQMWQHTTGGGRQAL